jgi:hypothetical protein
MQFGPIWMLMTKQFEILFESGFRHPATRRMSHPVWCDVSHLRSLNPLSFRSGEKEQRSPLACCSHRGQRREILVLITADDDMRMIRIPLGPRQETAGPQKPRRFIGIQHMIMRNSLQELFNAIPPAFRLLGRDGWTALIVEGAGYKSMPPFEGRNVPSRTVERPDALTRPILLKPGHHGGDTEIAILKNVPREQDFRTDEFGDCLLFLEGKNSTMLPAHRIR